MGIDGGGLDDLLGVAVLGRTEKARRWLLWSKAWAHLSVLERRKGEASVLRDFEEAGELVDPLVGAFNAIALMSTNPWSQQAQIFCDLESKITSVVPTPSSPCNKVNGLVALCRTVQIAQSSPAIKFPLLEGNSPAASIAHKACDVDRPSGLA